MMGIRPGKETVDMCKAAEEWKEELLTQGRAEGYNEKALIVYRNCLDRGMSKQDAIAISGITSELLNTISV